MNKEINEVSYSVPISKIVELCGLLKELQDNQLTLMNDFEGQTTNDHKRKLIVVRQYEKELAMIKDNIEYLKTIGGEPF